MNAAGPDGTRDEIYIQDAEPLTNGHYNVSEMSVGKGSHSGPAVTMMDLPNGQHGNKGKGKASSIISAAGGAWRGKTKSVAADGVDSDSSLGDLTSGYRVDGHGKPKANGSNYGVDVGDEEDEADVEDDDELNHDVVNNGAAVDGDDADDYIVRTDHLISK